MNNIKLTGAALAIGAAAAFSVIPAVATAHGSCHHHHHMVKCLTVNACRGLSSCKTAGNSCQGLLNACKSGNSCKGLNSCRGRGFVFLSKTQCRQILGNNAVWYPNTSMK